MGISDQANAAADDGVARKAMEDFVQQTGLNGLLGTMSQAGFSVTYSDAVERPGLKIDIMKNVDAMSALAFRLVLSAQSARGFNQPLIEYYRDDRKIGATDLLERQTLSSPLEIPSAISSWIMDNLSRVTGAAKVMEHTRGADISPSQP